MSISNDGISIYIFGYLLYGKYHQIEKQYKKEYFNQAQEVFKIFIKDYGLYGDIKENVDIVKSKEKLSKRILIGIYLGIWALSILTFWLFTGEQDGIGYSLMVFYCIIPVTTFIISFLIGKETKTGYII